MQRTRVRLPHEVPAWAGTGAVFFITVCTVTRGQNQLCNPDRSATLIQSINGMRDNNAWSPHLVLFMPDHLHMLVSFSDDPGMLASIKNWKRYTARIAGIRWQDGFFDHRIRRDESFVEKAAYIRMNPVRAGLVKTPEEWQYAWEYAREV